MDFVYDIKKLKWITLAYLALPIFIFLIGYLEIFWAILSISTLLISIYFWKRNLQSKVISIPLFNLFALLVIGFAWVAFSGAGGMGLVVPDLNKHISIYKDLIEKGVPTVYSYQNKTYYLAAYLGYYLPMPVLLGSWGYKVVMAGQFLFTLLGTFLGLVWFSILVQNSKWYVYLVFILIGGFDILGFFDRMPFDQAFRLLTQEFYEHQPFWSNDLDQNLRLLYHGNTHDLYWSPQHSIFNWLLCGMFFYELFYQKNILNSFIYLVFGFFWSPLVMLGLFPFVLSQLRFNQIKGLFSWQNIAMIPTFIFIILFVNSVPVADLQNGIIFYKAERKLMMLVQIVDYFKFVLYEVGLWFLFIWIVIPKLDFNKYKKPLGFVAILLLLIPLYRLGKWNDFVQRVSMPSLYALFAFLVYFMNQAKRKVKIIFAILVLLSSWDALYHITLSIKVTNGRFKYTVKPEKQINDFLVTTQKEKWPVEQSFANEDALFFKYFAKK